MALGYREKIDQLLNKNIIVYGMNDKDAESARAWVEKENLPFSVLMDTNRSVGIQLGISEASSEKYVANNADGRRPAVVIDEHGLIIAWEPDMNSVETIDELISRL